jgi:thiamine monophosphate synthase
VVRAITEAADPAAAAAALARRLRSRNPRDQASVG